MKIIDKLKKIEVVSTWPLATEDDKINWKEYIDNKIDRLELIYRFDKIRIDRNRKWFSFDNCKRDEKYIHRNQ